MVAVFFLLNIPAILISIIKYVGNDLKRCGMKECIVSVLVFSYRIIILCSYCKHLFLQRKLNMFTLESYFTRSYNTYLLT